jgi:hypothetical protein
MIASVTDSAVTNSAGTARPPYGVAALISLGVFALYALTVAPTTQFWDTSEYIASARVLGIPHPPGNPLFVLLANVWGQLLFFVEHYALRINLFAAATSAASSALLFLVAERWLRPVIADRWPRAVAAFAGILVGATAFTVWNQSVVNEKVYTVSLFFIALILWLSVRWHDLESGHHRDGILLLIAYLLTLGSTNHLMGVLVASAVLVYVVTTDWRQAIRPWVVLLAALVVLALTGWWQAVVDGPAVQRVGVLALLAGTLGYVAWKDPVEFRQPALYLAVLVVVVGISLNFTFLPMRAGQFPPINEGEPATWDALWSVLKRDQYAKPPLSHRMADFGSQIAHYLQYYAWQFGRDWPGARRLLAGLFGLIGLLGAGVQWRRDRRAAAAMTALMLTVTLLLIYYLNFRYGYSIRPREALDREVRERDYFFVASFQLWGLWVAIGLGAIWAWLQRGGRKRLSPRVAWIATAPVLLVALVPLAGNRLTASRADEWLARDFAYDLLQSVEPYGVLITAGDNDLFPLWYAQEVEGIRRDVTVLNQSLMNTNWHIKQILRRPQYPFDLENAVAPYRDLDVPPPEGPVLDLRLEQVDSLPLLWSVERRSQLRMGQLTMTLEAGTYEQTDYITLQAIRDNLGRRPVYFARTTGNSAYRYGLSDHLLDQGFVWRLSPVPLTAGRDTVQMPGFGWMDLERTERLLFDVYHPESAARARPRGWVDPPSQNILSLYYSTYSLYGYVVQELGDSAGAERRRTGQLGSGIGDRILRNLHLPPRGFPNEQPRLP